MPSRKASNKPCPASTCGLLRRWKKAFLVLLRPVAVGLTDICDRRSPDGSSKMGGWAAAQWLAVGVLSQIREVLVALLFPVNGETAPSSRAGFGFQCVLGASPQCSNPVGCLFTGSTVARTGRGREWATHLGCLCLLAPNSSSSFSSIIKATINTCRVLAMY